MVIDTSAIVASIRHESSAQALAFAIGEADQLLVSAATVMEASLVLMGRLGSGGDRELDRFLDGIGATIVPVTKEQVAIARDGAMRFGRGRHRAALNFGDCFSYALSIDSGEPLLFVGSDFSQTDVEVAPWQE